MTLDLRSALLCGRRDGMIAGTLAALALRAQIDFDNEALATQLRGLCQTCAADVAQNENGTTWFKVYDCSWGLGYVTAVERYNRPMSAGQMRQLFASAADAIKTKLVNRQALRIS